MTPAVTVTCRIAVEIDTPIKVILAHVQKHIDAVTEAVVLAYGVGTPVAAIEQTPMRFAAQPPALICEALITVAAADGGAALKAVMEQRAKDRAEIERRARVQALLARVGPGGVQ